MRETLKNVLFPLITGALIYYLLSPDVYFVAHLDKVIGAGFHITAHDAGIPVFLRNYLPDIMWGYALEATVIIILGPETSAWKTIMPAVLLAVCMEVLQLTDFISGTFDILDIVVEIAAILLATSVFSKGLWRKRK